MTESTIDKRKLNELIVSSIRRISLRHNWVVTLIQLEHKIRNFVTFKWTSRSHSFICDSKSLWLCFLCRTLRDVAKFGSRANPIYIKTKDGTFRVGKDA